MRRESDGERRRGRAEGRTYRELFMHATVADRYEERETCGMVWQATDREETHIAPPIRQHLILRLVHPHPRYTTHYFHILKPL